MFQLFEFLASHFGPTIVGAMQNIIFALMEASDCDECGFNDLGKLLLGGLVLAVVVGILISVLRRRISHDESGSPNFVSIRSSERK